jgi:hypothetical protein
MPEDDVVELTLRFDAPVTREDLREEFERRTAALAEDSGEGITVEWTGAHCRRRLRFVSRDDGGWRRIEERRNGGEWRPVGSEIVADLVVEDNAGVATNCAATGVRGP